MRYSIGELAELAGVSARTLRYYDRIGLLKPAGTSGAGYRFYEEREVDLLQQILFYRERGIDLERIKKIIYQEDFDTVRALEEHLLELEAQQARMEAVIRMVKHTIRAKKGETDMSDKEKFEAFKKRVVKEHEEAYGEEARGRYGDDEVDEAQRKVLNMSEEDWERFQNLGREVRERLNEAVQAGIRPDSEEAGRIVMLHKEWLGMTWKEYSEQAHRALAEMYTQDERFTRYYDRDVRGCAEFLRQAVNFKIGS